MNVFLGNLLFVVIWHVGDAAGLQRSSIVDLDSYNSGPDTHALGTHLSLDNFDRYIVPEILARLDPETDREIVVRC